MEQLELPDNERLVGSLPESLLRLSLLRDLRLFDVSLTGSLPESVVGEGSSSWTQLSHLSLQKSGLGGTLSPTFIGGLTTLEHWYMDENNFFGTLPTEVGMLQALLSLGASYNSFSGTIPEEVASLTALRKSKIVVDDHMEGESPHAVCLSRRTTKGVLSHIAHTPPHPTFLRSFVQTTNRLCRARRQQFCRWNEFLL